MTDFPIDNDIEAFRPHLQRFLSEKIAPQAAKWRQQKSLDRDVWRLLGEFGILLPSIPEEYGGQGKTFAFDAVIIEEVEKIVPELTHGIMGHNAINPHYILRYGSEAQKKRWLPRLAKGELTSAIAISEPAAGSDMRSIQMRARASGRNYILNGQKTFVTNGNIADLIIVAAKTDVGGENSVSLFIFDATSAAGFKRGRNLEKMGLHASGASELFFDNVVVDGDCLLGSTLGLGIKQMTDQLPQERLAIAVSAVASMERAISITLRYAKDRTAFGRPIIEFQANGFTLAEVKTEAFIARVFINWCIDRLVLGELDVVSACMAKWWSTETQMRVVDACLQMHGGYGYMDEYEISRMFTGARAQKIYGGSNEIMKHVIAKSLAD